MENVSEKVARVNEMVKSRINQNEDISISQKHEGRMGEEFLFSIPYNSIPITSPAREGELPIIIQDVILAVKQEMDKMRGTSKYAFELYTDDCQKIAESDENGRMIFDRTVEDKFSDQIKKIIEAGYEPAGVTYDEKMKMLSMETYFDLIGRKLVVMNKDQKELAEGAERRKVLGDVEKENMDPEVDESEDLDPKKEQDQDLIKENMNNDLQINASKITKIDPSDGAFWENNPDIKSRNAYAVLTDKGELQIVGESNGKFEPVDGFKNSSNIAGRTTIIKNDEDDLSDNTKNTYGSLESSRNPDMRYTLEYGQYGEIKLVEQVKVHSEKIEESDRYVSREVATSNTNFTERNLEGNENSNNITVRTFRQNSTNRDAAYYGKSNGKGGVSEVGKTMNKHGNPHDYTMETYAANNSQRVAEAERLVKNELKERGINLTQDEEKELNENLTKYIGNSENIFCKEDAERFATGVQNKRENEQNRKNEDSDKGRSRLDEAAERRVNRKF
ncbi:MAG: hypothetical protein IKE01_04090 [Clostridia bacterium]|nr:hypothetical protein [Clostridia bacterium]